MDGALSVIIILRTLHMPCHKIKMLKRKGWELFVIRLLQISCENQTYRKAKFTQCD